MDLRQLKSFLHVVELGSLSRAAERLAVTQPALSRQIRLLEEDLGVPLLVRTGRGVIPSEAGQRFEARIRPLVADLEAAAVEVAEEARQVSGSLVLAVPPSISAEQTADLLELYRGRYPRVAVRVVVALSGGVRDGLLKGRLDLGIIYHPATSSNLVTEDLWTERLLLVGPSSAGLGREMEVPFAKVATKPLVLPGPRHGLRAVVDAYALRQGLEVRTVVEAESLRLQLELVRRGVGFTLLPLRVVAGEVAAGHLGVANVTDPPLERTAALAWARDFRPSRAAQAMAALIREQAPGWERLNDATRST